MTSAPASFAPSSATLGAITLACAALLAGCGGGGSPNASTAPVQNVTATTISGNVAVGVAITDGTVRVIDATGAVVASVTVNPDGSYATPALTGTAPYRIEACGYAGADYQCLYSVAQGPGTANVTPLTSATVLLATGKPAGELMTGDGSGLDASAIDGAQAQLRTGLATVLTGNVPAGFDFIGGTLDAGSRTGYDKVLDSIGVKSGVDEQPFVQITPRLGSGNLYIEKGTAPIGQLTPDTAASALSLAGLDTLFANMTTAIASQASCNSLLLAQLASNATMSMDDGDPISGPTAVAQGLCQFLGGGESGHGPAMWGSRFVSPTLGRCDFSGAAPVCRVGFVIQDTDGGLNPVGNGMAVTFEGSVWKFKGDASAVPIHASARAQRSRRIDGDAPVDSYVRALAFDIPALTGLQCAKVTQPNADPAGAAVTVAYYKRFSGSTVNRLSVARVDADIHGGGGGPSLDGSGSAQRSDDTWLMLPGGAEGDAVVRNFLRGGRTVNVSLYADAGCSAPLVVAGKSQFEVDVEGVPPVDSALPSLPWATLTDSAQTNLRTLTMPAGSTASYLAAWAYDHGVQGINGLSFCADGSCGDGEPGRIGSADLSAAVTSKTVTLTTTTTALNAGSFRMLALYGRTGDGLGLQSNFVVCGNEPFCQ